MLKAQLSTSKVHEVYPSLYGRILRAHGAVSDLIGGRLEQTYQDYDRDDFDELLRRKCLPNSERERLLDAIGADREKGIRELHYALRRVQIHNARTEIMKASNFRILKGLYLSRPVQALTSQILTSVSTSWAEIQTEFEIEKRGRVASQGNPFEKLQEVLGKVDQLQQLMQKELEPMELQKHLATSASIANRVPRD
jgi:hypothetical protein